MTDERRSATTGTAAARLTVVESVAKEAGRLAASFHAKTDGLQVEMKGPQDFVTAADRAAERLIIERLSAAFPGSAFLGEEGGSQGSVAGAQMLWVIDPIDGTANFVRDRAEWVVSIGLLEAGEPTLGVIYQPSMDRLYAAERGYGAALNGKPIRVSETASLAAATIVLESSLGPHGAAQLKLIGGLRDRGGEYSRLGSAALSLALVADGRIDGFHAAFLNSWDVAAGIVLVREAGGWTSDFFAGEGLLKGNSLVAGSPAIRDELTKLAEPTLSGA
jgi:myo-inositol-1(or 4)-monophosphatase